MIDPPTQQWQRGAYTISTDRARIDIDVVHAYLTRSYWAEGIPRDVVARAIAGALNFGIYHDAKAAADVAQPSPAVSRSTTELSADLQSAPSSATDTPTPQRSAGFQPASSAAAQAPNPHTQSSADLQSARVTTGDPSQSATTTQIGGARIVTDCATFAYVADVFVLEEHRSHGLGIWLMECVAAHPSLQGLRRWMLGTRDAHTLYEKTGWTRINPDDGRWMERAFPDLYKQPPSTNT